MKRSTSTPANNGSSGGSSRPSTRPSRWMVIVGVLAAIALGVGWFVTRDEPGAPVQRPSDSSASLPALSDDQISGPAVDDEQSSLLFPHDRTADFGIAELVELPYARGGTVAVPVAALESAAAQLRAFFDEVAIETYTVEFLSTERIGLTLTWSGAQGGSGLFVVVATPAGWESATGHMAPNPFG